MAYFQSPLELFLGSGILRLGLGCHFGGVLASRRFWSDNCHLDLLGDIQCWRRLVPSFENLRVGSGLHLRKRRVGVATGDISNVLLKEDGGREGTELS
jgi:hypothetical protein